MLRQVRSLRLFFALLVILLSGCAAYAVSNWDQLYGKSAPRQRLVVSQSAAGVTYHNQIKPILENRCVVCHGCYDAPCQLKLASPQGIERGLSKIKVYDGARLFSEDLSRLYQDAQTTSEWRQKKFFPVLNERNQTAAVNLHASLMYRSIELKKAQPAYKEKVLDSSYDFSLDRNQQCPKVEQYDKFAGEYPGWGMPYGLPALSSDEFATLADWLGSGAAMAKKKPLSEDYLQQIETWEAWFNQGSPKARLVSRYIYEHLYLSHLYFEDLEKGEFFKLVRSKTPPGRAIQVIATRRPYDDPKVSKFYYRFQRERESILAKTHMPYSLSKQRMERYNQLFFKPEYQVTELPSYTTSIAANPFVAFRHLPAEARYQFMLDDAQNTIMGFIKGPVCRGQIALNVINDHFWVFFAEGDLEGDNTEQFLAEQSDHLRLPAQEASDALILTNWIKYSRFQEKYLQGKSDWMNQYFKSGGKLDLDVIWSGNSHAALTIFRHFDSASVVKGLVGQSPKTAWIIDYPLLERIHYLLVAGFDVYGNVGHQLITRLYMDFLRMEGEYNFLALLPKQDRTKELGYWYRNAEKSIINYVTGDISGFHQPSNIHYQTANPKQELFGLLKEKLKPILGIRYQLQLSDVSSEDLTWLSKLNELKGAPVNQLAELSSLMLVDKQGNQSLYTLIRNVGHSNISSLLDEAASRLPEEDYLTLVRGVLGDYPNVFLKVSSAELPLFVRQISKLKSESDYAALLDNFAIRRTSDDFWPHSDRVLHLYKQAEPIEAGLLDYNRLENR